jgi:hypothetical protein
MAPTMVSSRCGICCEQYKAQRVPVEARHQVGLV